MTKFKLFSVALLTAVVSLSAHAGDSYSVKSDASSVEWYAKKVTGKHNGSIGIKSGDLTFEGDKLVGGSFVIDMSTIKVLDLEEGSEMNQKLTGHLNSPDFFNVAEFTESTLKITSAKQVKSEAGNYEITADLTIKGKTSPVTFNANVANDGSKVAASAEIVFDRSKYDVRYGSKSFFDNLGDKVIYDDVKMVVSLIAE